MDELVTHADVEHAITARRERFEQTIADIVRLLEADIPRFITKRTREAFLANPAVSGAMGSDAVRALKSGAAELGGRAAARVRDEVAIDSAPWSAGPTETGTPKTLDEAPVWASICAFEADLGALLEGAGLPASGLSYRAPVFFIEGRYFPALAENYWRLRAEMAALAARLEVLEHDASRRDLEAVWDEA